PVDTLGVNRPRPTPIDQLGAGEVGFLTASIKAVADVQIGDTITEAARPTLEPFPGFQEIKPMVFAGLFPVDADSYEDLRDALDKLRLNDASFFYEPETSAALGFGFRCGFLGLLHMEIVQERLEREFNMDLVTTAPGVLYRVTTTDGEVQEIDSPAKLPDAGRIDKIEEPIITAMILTPVEHVGGILQLCQDKRGVQKSLEYLSSDRVLVTYELPFNEVAIQAAIGGRIIARESVKALRKNVLAKCYGGDISRKRKLLEKQKEGKKRMKRVGKVEIPQEAFLAVLKMGTDTE